MSVGLSCEQVPKLYHTGAEVVAVGKMRMKMFGRELEGNNFDVQAHAKIVSAALSDDPHSGHVCPAPSRKPCSRRPEISGSLPGPEAYPNRRRKSPRP